MNEAHVLDFEARQNPMGVSNRPARMFRIEYEM